MDQDGQEFLAQAYRQHFLEIMRPNIELRWKMYDKMNKDEGYCILVKEKCKRSFVWFCNHFLWVHEPRKKYQDWYGWPSPQIPFILYDYQEDQAANVIDCINSGQDVLIDKSRDMGATWLVVSILFWMWLFGGKGNDFLLGSRKLEYVDKKGASDTLFEKIRYNLYIINPYLFPEGFDKTRHDLVGLLINPMTGSYFRAEANNANFGTSGRYKAIMADEFSKWAETDEQAYTSMGSSADCSILVSTPWGMGGKFAQLRFDGSIRVESMHWVDHPLKGAGKYQGQHPYFPDKKDVWLSPWYLMECERRKDNPQARIGQELDIDYLSSGMPFFNNQIVQELHKELEADLPEVTSYEFEHIEDGVRLYESGSGRIKMLEKPDQGWKYRYCIGCDVAEGLEKGDNSAFYVYDRVELKDVLYFTGKVDTTILAYLLSYVGYWYCEATIGVESNNHGHAVLQRLKEMYSNLYRQGDFTKVVDIHSVKLGWNTNVTTRPIMCGAVRDLVNTRETGVFDIQFFQECLTFIYNKNGKPEADAGCLDDRVMAQGVKMMVHQWMPAPKKIDRSFDRFKGKHRFGHAPRAKKDIRSIWT